MNLSDLESRLQIFGLHLRGLIKLTDEEKQSLQPDADKQVSIALVGNIGSSYWPVFSESAEYRDGRADPLDRWSRRVSEQVAAETGAKPLYPFEGPPYFPFQQWAKRAESLSQSPLGLMIHPQYGLWHSYRFGLLITGAEIVEKQWISSQSPCETCEAQPCLNTCPVEAFSLKGYDVGSCAAYLKQTPDAPCHQQGCLARNSCPAGESYRYAPAQHCFHLQAFLTARWDAV